MSNSTIRLLERVRERTETKTPYAVAKALGISTQRVYRYFSGEDVLSEDAVLIRAAEILKEDAAVIVSHFRAENAKDQSARKMWQRIEAAMRSGGAPTAAALLLAMGVTMAPSPASGMQSQPDFQPVIKDRTMYIMLSCTARNPRPYVSGGKGFRHY